MLGVNIHSFQKRFFSLLYGFEWLFLQNIPSWKKCSLEVWLRHKRSESSVQLISKSTESEDKNKWNPPALRNNPWLLQWLGNMSRVISFCPRQRGAFLWTGSGNCIWRKASAWLGHLDSKVTSEELCLSLKSWRVSWTDISRKNYKKSENSGWQMRLFLLRYILRWTK